jgi:hypothetical protein
LENSFGGGTFDPSERRGGIMSSKILLRISSLICIYCFFGWGCSWSGTIKAPTLSKAQIESKVMDFAKLKEIHLNETAKGNYEGSGAGEDGTPYKIKVTYTRTESEGKGKNEIRWDVEGPKGAHECGQDVDEGGGGFSVGVGR